MEIPKIDPYLKTWADKLLEAMDSENHNYVDRKDSKVSKIANYIGKRFDYSDHLEIINYVDAIRAQRRAQRW
jgi:hypothetical protein